MYSCKTIFLIFTIGTLIITKKFANELISNNYSNYKLVKFRIDYKFKINYCLLILLFYIFS